MNIKALPSMGQRLFCCFCFVESAVCSTFAERIIRGCFRGCTCLKCTNKTVLQHLLLRWCTSCYVGVPLATLVYHLLRWCTTCYVGALETSAPPEDTPLAP